MHRVTKLGIIFLSLIAIACNPANDNNKYNNFAEKEYSTIKFTNADVVYNGDDIGEGISDGWVIKLYTDMEMDMTGNLIGPGSVMQLLLNAPYDKNQKPNPDNLIGSYSAQSNSGDFLFGTFIYGYIDYLDLPTGRIYRPDGTFYASILEGSTSADMDADLIDDGSLNIYKMENGEYSIRGTLVGKHCRKRYFEWQGKIEPKSYAVEQVPNSLLSSNLQLTNLTKACFKDKKDSFYLGDESCRTILVFLTEDGISYDKWGTPGGSGDMLRIELTVPWATDIATDGIPAGEYPMMVRNADTSIDKENILPFYSIPGLPNSFSAPYWAGAWYVKYADGKWGDIYACIDKGVVTVERGADGSHRFICNLQDCSSPSYAVTTDVTIDKENTVTY
uniref:hypothetical protein n=1 Tax=Alistipes sp. TaxID=1872444 RepID=UPI00405626E0